MSPVMDFITEIDRDFDYDHWENCPNTVGESEGCPECCRSRYYSGERIDYSCPQFQRVYVMRYLPVHIHENLLALRRIPTAILEELSLRQEFHISSFGGGPGSDILAVKRFLLDEYLGDLDGKNITILRIEQQEDWNQIAEQINHLLTLQNANLRHLRRNADILQPLREPNQRSQIIMLSYLISEIDNNDIQRLSENIQKFADNLCVIIINDRNEDVVVHKVEKLLKILGAKGPRISQSQEHCGEFYPDELRDRVVPKLTTTSIRYTAVIRS